MATTDRAFRGLARAQPDFVAEMLHVLAPDFLPRGSRFTLDDLAPTQVDALPQPLDADCIARVGDKEIRHIEFQGYHDPGFSNRCVWYHVGTALRYRGKRRVRSFALWLTRPPSGQPRDVMTHDDISVRVTTVLLAEVPAEKLLENPKTVCLASGANPGNLTVEELCRRVAARLHEHQASWPERHVAVVAAAAQERYNAMVAAMEEMHMEPVIIEDLVRIGEKRGEKRGQKRERIRMCEGIIVERLGRPLTSSERKVLVERVDTMSTKEINSMLVRARDEALEAWLAQT